MFYAGKKFRYAVKGLTVQTFTEDDAPEGYPEIFKKSGGLRAGWILTNQL